MDNAVNKLKNDEFYKICVDQEDKDKPIPANNGYFLNVSSIFIMLAGDAKTEREGETNIRARFKELARIHNLTFYKSKERMLKLIMQHSESREMIFRTYVDWYNMNSDTSSPTGMDMVGFQPGTSSHNCTPHLSRRRRRKR